MRQHHLLCVTKSDDQFVIGLDSRTMPDAERARAWQQIGAGGFDRYAICTYDKATDEFVAENGNRYNPDRGVYTEKAWSSFKERLAK